MFGAQFKYIHFQYLVLAYNTMTTKPENKLNTFGSIDIENKQAKTCICATAQIVFLTTNQ